MFPRLNLPSRELNFETFYSDRCPQTLRRPTLTSRVRAAVLGVRILVVRFGHRRLTKLWLLISCCYQEATPLGHQATEVSIFCSFDSAFDKMKECGDGFYQGMEEMVMQGL